LTAEALAALFAPWEARALAEIAAEAGDGAAVRLERSADLRYTGQSFEINVPAPPGIADPDSLAAEFHARHERRYGHAHPAAPVEVVTLRVRAIGPTPPLNFEPLPATESPDPAPARLAVRPAWFETGGKLKAVPTAVFDREALRAGHAVAGPAIVVQLDATTVIPPGWAGEVGKEGHLALRQAN
jgi:N-methylhydantoinase A